MTSSEWAAWVQAVGSILAIAAGFAVAYWQRWQEDIQRQKEADDLQLRLAILIQDEAEVARNYIDKVIAAKDLSDLLARPKTITESIPAQAFLAGDLGAQWLKSLNSYVRLRDAAETLIHEAKSAGVELAALWPRIEPVLQQMSDSLAGVQRESERVLAAEGRKRNPSSSS